MAKRMLIDATHSEETRVVILNENRVEDFDVESSTKKQIKGNIYLAKVVRVEPSLQACFVEYGGNRHGFLSFSEIHPDYYQIPPEDRAVLLAESQEDEEDEEAEEAAAESTDDQSEPDSESESQTDPETESESEPESEPVSGALAATPREPAVRRAARPPRKTYMIQDVIMRRQLMLVQIVKEERGSKGAALTTYISLAGRYCVLMPNSPKTGGISRKITSAEDRKRLKELLREFDLPKGVAAIVRTAGMERTKSEIKRDFDYVFRLWEDIRELTLKSHAPCLIHEEGDLIRRAIRDLYSRDVEEILVEGEAGYQVARNFMRLIVPSHVKKVVPYRDPSVPLMQRYQVETQLDAIHSPTVQLRSGGYIVINPTEALVAIDVNSGRATKERHIEETAFKTNIEAADEVARQIRLRDLAGLVVIDFIDMEESRNIHAVERRLREAMKNDRARIQIGRISSFGLMELSRQRLRSSLLESSSTPCPHCGGTGHQRSTESSTLHVLRALEEEGMGGRTAALKIEVPTEIALFIMNQKRTAIDDIESRYGCKIEFARDDSLIPPNFRISNRVTRAAGEFVPPPRIGADYAIAEEEFDESAFAADQDTEEEESFGSSSSESYDRSELPEAPVRGAEGEDSERRPGNRGRNRQRGQSRRERHFAPAEGEAAQAPTEPVDSDLVANPTQTTSDEGLGHGEETSPRRRRGRRGGRRRQKRAGEGHETAAGEASSPYSPPHQSDFPVELGAETPSILASRAEEPALEAFHGDSGQAAARPDFDPAVSNPESAGTTVPAAEKWIPRRRSKYGPINRNPARTWSEERPNSGYSAETSEPAPVVATPVAEIPFEPPQESPPRPAQTTDESRTRSRKGGWWGMRRRGQELP